MRTFHLKASIKQLLTTLTSDWVVVDTMTSISRGNRLLRPYVQGLLVIDDQGARAHDCDIYVNPDDVDFSVQGLLPPTRQMF